LDNTQIPEERFLTILEEVGQQGYTEMLFVTHFLQSRGNKKEKGGTNNIKATRRMHLFNNNKLLLCINQQGKESK